VLCGGGRLKPRRAAALVHPFKHPRRQETGQAFRSKFGAPAVKPFLPALILIVSLGASYAAPVDGPSLNQTSSVTTEYPAFHAFHHTVGGTSYVGYYFNGKPSNCSVLIWSKANNEIPSEKPTHQKVRIELNAKQSITFLADELGSNLSLECAADGKSLSVRQTSISLTQ
jgi:hypothetical protein